MNKHWININNLLPKEGTLVATKIEDRLGTRNIARLIRKGNLWFVPDMSMYVYYTPTHWQSIQ